MNIDMNYFEQMEAKIPGGKVRTRLLQSIFILQTHIPAAHTDAAGA